MTSMSDEPQQIRYETTGPGRARLHLGEEDISDRVGAVNIEHVAGGHLPIVTLTLSPSANDEVLFDGLAHIQIAAEQDAPGPLVAEFLAAIDPAQLEKAALNRPDLGAGPSALTQAMLTQLIDWALGKD